MLSWKAYYQVAITNAPPEDRVALSNRNEQVYSASRSFAAALMVADSLRETCATNAAASNRTALQLTLNVAHAQASNLVWLVNYFTTTPVGRVPIPDEAPAVPTH